MFFTLLGKTFENFFFTHLPFTVLFKNDKDIRKIYLMFSLIPNDQEGKWYEKISCPRNTTTFRTLSNSDFSFQFRAQRLIDFCQPNTIIEGL